MQKWFIKKALPENRTARINAIFGIISLSLWLFEIISGVPSCIFMIYCLKTDIGRLEGMSLFLFCA